MSTITPLQQLRDYIYRHRYDTIGDGALLIDYRYRHYIDSDPKIRDCLSFAWRNKSGMEEIDGVPIIWAKLPDSWGTGELKMVAFRPLVDLPATQPPAPPTAPAPT